MMIIMMVEEYKLDNKDKIYYKIQDKIMKHHKIKYLSIYLIIYYKLIINSYKLIKQKIYNNYFN